jgi:hypothetical protein
METAKVDIKKLQLLNDRITQCFEALNQVRLSVHGLSQSQQGYPGAIPSSLQGGQPFGLSHTSPYGVPSPYGVGIPGVVGGFGQQPIGLGQQPMGFGQQTLGFGQPSMGFPFVNPNPYGLSHTSPEIDYTRPVWADPILASRIAQTFPYAPFALPPVVSLY